MSSDCGVLIIITTIGLPLRLTSHTLETAEEYVKVHNNYVHAFFYKEDRTGWHLEKTWANA